MEKGMTFVDLKLIFEKKVFLPEKFTKTEYFLTKIIYAANCVAKSISHSQPLQIYVVPVSRKIPFPCLPPTSGIKMGILRNMGAT